MSSDTKFLGQVGMGYHLFIDPLPRHFTCEELKALLEKFGRVRGASIAYDSTGKSLGFGRVEMESELAADEACKHLHMTILHNSNLTVVRASEHDSPL